MTQQLNGLRNHRRPIFGLLMIVALAALLAGCAPAAQPTAAPVAAQPTEAPVQAPVATDAPAQPPAASEAPGQSTAVTFAKDVQPLLEQKCVKCHGSAGGLSVKSYASLMEGGKSGAVIVPGDPTNSKLVQLIIAGKMPQGAAKLPQNEIDVISAWVMAGAKND